MEVFTREAANRLLIGSCSIVAIFVAVPLLVVPFLVSPGRSEKRDVSPSQFLMSATGMPIANGWSVIDSGDDHGGFVGDGETFAVFQLTQGAIDTIVNSAPPWSAQWKMGPVPGEIGVHCKFGTDGVGFGGAIGEVDSYSGNESLVRLLGSPHVVFDAKERCCDTMPWHNGHLIVIDLASRTVWLSVWDF